MKTLRRLSYLALGVAYTHLVFGAIVRITGSGMGCGDHWPKCLGHWFPPMNQPTIVIEWTHRLLASLLLVSLVVLAAAAWRKRDEPGVRERGVLSLALIAPVLWLAPALLGMVTVFLGNPAGATAAHWVVAMIMVAVITAIAIRAGALGGAGAREQAGTSRAAKGAMWAAAIALVVVAMGGLTAKIPFGSVACPSFPLCGSNPAAPASAAHIQLTHRILAYLLFFHLLGTAMAMRRRAEAPVVKRAAFAAFGFVVLQVLVAGAMIGMKLPPVLRSLHEAVGVAIWIATFTFAYLARLAARNTSEPARLESPRREPLEAVPPSGEVRVPSTPVAESREVTPKSTPPHTIAVIVARGADL